MWQFYGSGDGKVISKVTIQFRLERGTRIRRVCHNRRIKSHKVFGGLAQRGKTSVDWIFGFKLHLVVNEVGQLLNAQITPSNIDDRRPVPDLLQNLFGNLSSG